MKFANKKEEIAYIVANKAEIIDLKKSEIKRCDNAINLIDKGNMNKYFSHSSDTESSIKRTIVASTYLWMDSHLDVHLPGVFGKSISENMPVHLHDHLFQITAKVGKPISAYESYINWTDLGINKSGQTQVLFVDSEILKQMNEQIFFAYLNGEVNQHSVGMQYVKLSLAVNDTEYKDELAVWQQWYPQLGNPEAADQAGYFWAIKEAKLPEFSCVIAGSNILTPTLGYQGKGTHEEPGEKSTQNKPLKPAWSISNIIKNI